MRAGEIVRHLRRLVGRGEGSVKPHLVSELVHDACSIALLGSSRLGITYEIAGDTEAASVLVDSVQVQQVLMNLIRNSLEALESAPDKRLRIGWRSVHNEVEVWVEDSGPGIAAEVRPTLFEAFNTGKSGGLGIGLSISRTIVEAHGGQIRVEGSELGGARFVFNLRKAEQDV